MPHPYGRYLNFTGLRVPSLWHIEQKLQEYKDKHNGKEFVCDVSTKTIEDLCQLLQCQPRDIIDWEIDLKPELSYENRFKQE